MKWSIRSRLTAWYSAVVVTVLIAGAAAVSVAQWRLGVERLDGELRRLLLTLEGVMRTEFGEGLDLQAAADEASIEVVAPDRALFLAAPDGRIIAAWGRRLPLAMAAAARCVVACSRRRGRARRPAGEPSAALSNSDGHRYVAAVLAPLDDLNREHGELLAALVVGVLVALIAG